MTEARQPTLEDVAAAAGVSRALVSLVMRDGPGVSPQRRARVREAARRLGYRPNLAARSLASRRSHSVGVVLNDLRNPFHGEVAEGIDGFASAHGYRVLISAGNRRVRSEREALEAWLELRTAGIILVGVEIDAAEITAAARVTPVVVVTRHLRRAGLDTVVADDRRGAAMAVEHLAGLGHRRIVHVDGGAGAGAAVRRDGYRRAMRRLGLERHLRVVPGAFDDAAGARAVDQLWRGNDVPSAIFAANDLMAAGVLDRLARLGARVPEDVSVVGYDNTSLAALHHVSLTTVDQAAHRLGRIAMETLIERIDHPDRPASRRVLSPSLIVRRTTAPIHLMEGEEQWFPT